jgi:hypothetical protein
VQYYGQGLAEFKLAHPNWNKFEAPIRKLAGKCTDANEVSILVFVILVNDEVEEQQKITSSEVYKYFVLIPARTKDGKMNIRNDDPTASHLSIGFDRDRLTVTTHSGEQLLDTDAVVLVAGADGICLGDAEKAKLKGFCMRPRVDMASINSDFNTFRQEHERETKQKQQTRKQKRKRNAAA